MESRLGGGAINSLLLVSNEEEAGVEVDVLLRVGIVESTRTGDCQSANAFLDTSLRR